jgi:DNA-binding HxlR family transcriptional regulator
MPKDSRRMKKPGKSSLSVARDSGAVDSRFCPRFHHAVELIGRRWSGAIINAMRVGPQCFNELLVTIPGLSDRLLTERLREFESEGLVRRTVIAGPPVRVSYDLTKAGRDLEPAIEALEKWAEKWVKI